MQQVAKRSGAKKKPAIHISETDYDLIANYAMLVEARSPALAKTLFDEIDRATVHKKDKLPKSVVTLGAKVSYLDENSGAIRHVRLVLPAEADMEEGRLSILTPAGAGLIGLKAGQAIDWPCPDGRPRRLKILEVSQEP